MQVRESPLCYSEEAQAEGTREGSLPSRFSSSYKRVSPSSSPRARSSDPVFRSSRALVNGRPGPRSSPAGSSSKELVPVVQAFPALAGVQDKLDEIRAHVVNSLASKCLGSERIAGAWSCFECLRVFADSGT